MSEGYQRLVERIWYLFCFDWWGIKDIMVLPRAQRIKDTKSQHIMCVVITFDVSEAGNILFDMTDGDVAVFGRIIASRRIIYLKLIGFVKS